MYSSDTIMSSVSLRRCCTMSSASGMGLTMAPATESIMGSLPPAKAGVGSAVNDTTRQMGGALGVAVIGSVFASATTARSVGVAGAGAGPGAVQDSIGAALDAARNLPASDQVVVRTVVNHAYLVSMRVAYGIARAVVLIAAVSPGATSLAHAPDEGEAEEEEAELLAEAVPVTTGADPP